MMWIRNSEKANENIKWSGVYDTTFLFVSSFSEMRPLDWHIAFDGLKMAFWTVSRSNLLGD